MDKLKQNLKLFLESKYFIILIGLITVLSWKLKLNYFPYIILSLSFILIELVKAEYISVPSLFFLYVGGNQNNTMDVKSVGFYIILCFAIPAVILVLYNFFKNIKEYKHKLKDRLLYILIALFISMLISIINSPVKGLTIAYALTFFLNIFIVVLILTRVDINDTNKEKIVFSFMIILWTIAIEVLFKYIDIYEKGKMWEKLIQRQLHLGWFLSNHYMPIVNACMIISIYMYMSNKKVAMRIFSILTLATGILLNIITMSRGAYVGIVISAVVALIVYIKYTDDWKYELKYLIPTFVVLAIIIIVVLSTNIMAPWLDRLLDRGMDLTGREKLYTIAIEKFKENYLIGTGAGSSSYYIHNILEWDINNYHNSFLQISSTCGIIGLICFLIYLGISIRRIINNRDLFGMIVLVLFTYFFIHGLVDSLFFNKKIMPMLTIGLILLKEPKKIELFKIEQ